MLIFIIDITVIMSSTGTYNIILLVYQNIIYKKYFILLFR